MEQQFPDTDLPAYCRQCRAAGGCDATKGEVCPRPAVLPECLPAMLAYDACETQWRVGPGGVVGLDYTACIATLTLYLPRWEKEQPTADLTVPELLDDLRTIEQGLLTGMAEKAEKERLQRESQGHE